MGIALIASAILLSVNKVERRAAAEPRHWENELRTHALSDGQRWLLKLVTDL